MQVFPTVLQLPGTLSVTVLPSRQPAVVTTTSYCDEFRQTPSVGSVISIAVQTGTPVGETISATEIVVKIVGVKGPVVLSGLIRFTLAKIVIGPERAPQVRFAMAVPVDSGAPATTTASVVVTPGAPK